MIQEDYVSFETSKLLKEKGFNGLCTAYYDCFTTDNFHCGYEPTDFNSIDTKIRDIVAAPTLQMAMKWLREVHNLVIQIEFIDFLEHGEVWLYSIIERKTIKRLTDKDEDFTEHSYEEAAEAAIKYCLENLI